MPDLITQLTTAWNDQCDAEEHAPHTSRIPIWAAREPALATYSTLRAIERSTDDDPVLGALLRLAQGDNTHSGDTLAARLVLQRMMPAIRKLSSHLQRRMPAHAAQSEVIGTMWEQILSLSAPVGRTKIAANLDRNTHHVHSPSSKANQTKSKTEVPLASDSRQWVTQRPHLTPEPDTSLAVLGDNDQIIGDLAAMLTWARENDVLSADAADLLHTVYINTDNVGQAVSDLAARSGLSTAAINTRMTRAKKRLVLAIEKNGLVLANA